MGIVFAACKKFHARQISLNFVARGQKVSRFLRGMTAA
jgi:hypothetical protein